MKLITAAQAALQCAPVGYHKAKPHDRASAARWSSFFRGEVRRAGERKVEHDTGWRPNVRTTGADWRSCRDWQSHLMGGSFNIGESGTATGSSGTTLTNSGAAFPTTNNGYNGHIVAVGPNASGTGSTVYGVIISNTGTVLTVDRWVDAATPGAVGTTPNATAKYQILSGQAAAIFIAVSTAGTGSAASDTTLTSEITTNGLARAPWGTYAHTSGGTSYTLTKVFTASGSHAAVGRAAIFNAQNSGAMPFESDLADAPALSSGDTLTITAVVNL